jgi:hypothetical protein
MTRSSTGVEFASTPIPAATYPPHCPTRWLDGKRVQVDDLIQRTRDTYKRNDDGFGLINTESLEENDGPAEL